MQNHNITNKKKKRKRVGRGGKRGTYSGKGIKGQKSRSGHVLPHSALEVILKMPKLRGVKNKSFKAKPVIITLDRLNQLGVKEINKKILLEKGLIKNLAVPVKILNSGDIKTAVTISGIKISKGALAKIQKSGGSVQ